jgi:predicted transcriptional regulator
MQSRMWLSLQIKAAKLKQVINYSAMGKLLGELEEKVMTIIWSSEQALKPGEVQALLDSGLAYTTVMTILQRLADKGFLTRTKTKGTYYYQASVSKDKYVHTNLGDVLSNIVNSYGQLAISQFVDSVKTDPENLELLKKYLAEHTDEAA